MNIVDDYTEKVEDLPKRSQKTVAEEIGKTYNKLTISSFVCRNNHELYFNCTCECGKEKVVRLKALKIGDVKSCGCLKSERDDLTGQTFGLWTVLRRDPSKRVGVYYICRCECGTERSVCKYSLKVG